MFDAEIAAKLLNRWTVKPPAAQHDTSQHDSYLDMLREGNLDFTHQMGRVTLGDVSADGLFDLESLVFVDGSRALRLRTPGAVPDWTQWAAFEPPVARSAENASFRTSSDAPSDDESSCTLEAPER
ncbi:hypothetical protein VSR68_15595 [Paraburkholderia phymatum]|uniref:hypothetical protein n=1 Tax=Paraburkholderia phymatum TaxID=148447 RepID=UPI0031824E18